MSDERVYNEVALARMLELVLIKIAQDENANTWEKNAMRRAARDGFLLLWNGMKPISRGVSWAWPSRPGKTKTAEESRGHTVSVVDGKVVCSCEAGQHGIPCWARGATAILKQENKVTPVDDVDGEEIFPDDEPPPPPRQPALPIRNRIERNQGENPWKS